MNGFSYKNEMYEYEVKPQKSYVDIYKDGKLYAIFVVGETYEDNGFMMTFLRTYEKSVMQQMYSKRRY